MPIVVAQVMLATHQVSHVALLVEIRFAVGNTVAVVGRNCKNLPLLGEAFAIIEVNVEVVVESRSRREAVEFFQ